MDIYSQDQGIRETSKPSVGSTYGPTFQALGEERRPMHGLMHMLMCGYVQNNRVGSSDFWKGGRIVPLQARVDIRCLHTTVKMLSRMTVRLGQYAPQYATYCNHCNFDLSRGLAFSDLGLNLVSSSSQLKGLGH